MPRAAAAAAVLALAAVAQASPQSGARPDRAQNQGKGGQAPPTPSSLLSLQAASLHKPALPTPTFLLPPDSTNGTKADAIPTTLKSHTFPAGPQVSIPLAAAYDSDSNYGPILPWSDPRIGKQVPGCAPEQVHLSWWGSQGTAPSVLVSWATCDLGVDSYGWQGAAATTPLPAQDTSAATSRVWVGAVPGVYTKSFDGVATSYTVDSTVLLNGSPSPGGSYASPIIHHTLVSDLVPGATYYYKIDNAPQLPGGSVDGKPFFGSFKVPGGFPLRMGVGADSGEVSNVTININFLVAEAKPDVMLMTGACVCVVVWRGGERERVCAC
jgi:hypothetical protein